MYARRLQAALLSLAVIALAAPAAFAQPASTSPVIVVFHKDVSFAAYRQAYRSDSRMTAHPLRWAYLDRGLVGAVETLEAVQHFRARRMFSAALHGFAADLTAAQQQALARDPRVSVHRAGRRDAHRAGPGDGDGAADPAVGHRPD